jgi:hypothetical protein
MPRRKITNDGLEYQLWPERTATSVAVPVQEVSDEREDADEEKKRWERTAPPANSGG